MKINRLPVFTLVSSATLILAQGSVAQDIARSNGALEEVIVTAQKREQNLQAVPIAVTALTADTLRAFRVTNVEGLSNLAPNLNVQQQGRGTLPHINIRGVSSAVADAAVDPKIATYLDGVYIGRTVGSIFDLADIERVEVLRGPQGTLFGRNATGGAISIITAAPTGQLGFKQDFTFGNYDMLRSRSTLDLPAFGPLRLKVSYLHDEQEGYSDNLIGGQTIDLRLRDRAMGVLKYADKLGGKESDAVMVGAQLDVSDSVMFDYRFDYTDSTTVGTPTQQLGIVGATAPLMSAINAFQPLYGGITNLSSKPLGNVAAATSEEQLDISGHNLTLTWDINEQLNLKSITAYREMEQDPAIYDLGGTGGWKFTTTQMAALFAGDIPGILANPPGPNDSFFSILTARALEQDQVSQELQLTWTADRFDIVAGGFYFREESSSHNVLGVLQPVENGVVRPSFLDPIFGNGVNNSDNKNESFAAFVQGTWRVSDQLDFTLGLRRTEDKREFNLIEAGAAAGAGDLDEGIYDLDYGKTNYTVILNYRWAEDVMSYAKVGTGFAAGGIMNGIPYDPEEMTNYEIGLKSQFLDNRLRLNAAAFFMDYEDLQVQTFNDGKQRFENAGQVEVSGLELELDTVIVDGLTASASLGWFDFKYKEYLRNGVDISDDVRHIRAPDLNGRISLQYDLPETLFGGTPFMRLDSRYSSEAENLSIASGYPEIDRLSMRDAYWLVDLRAGLASVPAGSGKIDVSLWARNLLDEDDVNVYGNEVLNITGIYSRPRTYGVDFSFIY
ncbi:TonB-dependent receptor [Parahaliea maris]|uniref:TonB-dependent receptor n=1 Tax=Parahaliea maris TaxID=2716870 RepID=A0A5C8ZPV1_9GAMM|nr:TonB-dependent receptor [Parahaliea maris]TXS89824.1 TonB-dependent receptor [Parahaliea maris]